MKINRRKFLSLFTVATTLPLAASMEPLIASVVPKEFQFDDDHDEGEDAAIEVAERVIERVNNNVFGPDLFLTDVIKFSINEHRPSWGFLMVGRKNEKCVQGASSYEAEIEYVLQHATHSAPQPGDRRMVTFDSDKFGRITCEGMITSVDLTFAYDSSRPTCSIEMKLEGAPILVNAW